MNFIAFYLPQFHRVKENDEWWGEGFTDWVNVKRARRYFEGHRQPRIPLDDNYYDLSNVDDIRKQVSIANKYGVYGFCFYHYWFSGKMLLETPVSLLLKNTDININFCFSWANETWARTWDGKNHDILIKQTYGEEDDWESHFRYFLDYFRDDRYIKIKNKPMLLLYKSGQIPHLAEMLQYWQKRAKEAGFDGIHVVETLRDNSGPSEGDLFAAHVEFEPSRTVRFMSKGELWFNRFRRYSILAFNKMFKKEILANRIRTFGDICNNSITRRITNNTYPGLFMGWDNSPRKKTMSSIILEPNAEEFDLYVSAQVKKTKESNDLDNQFIFINAWNEWAEGTYLEPDSENKFKYLEIIKKYSQ